VALLLAMLVMRVLMAVADSMALIMAREMELDADRYEAMLVGPQVFAATAEKISAASVVLAEALEKAEQGGACPDNLARWAQFHVARMPPPQRRRLARLLTRDAQGAPHPPFEDRVENARATTRQGLMNLEGPATDLLRSFDNVARQVTLQWRPGVRFLPVSQLLPQDG
jgi:Zn-dependent protease with chaperone function